MGCGGGLRHNGGCEGAQWGAQWAAGGAGGASGILVYGGFGSVRAPLADAEPFEQCVGVITCVRGT